MRKLSKVLTFGLSLSLLAACGSTTSNASKNGTITGGDSYIGKNDSGKKTGTLQDLYNSMYDNEEAFNYLLAEIAKQELGLSYDKTTHTWTDTVEDDYNYASIINERRVDYLEETSSEYTSTRATNGVVETFDEERLVETLTKNGYTIACTAGYGPTLNEDWTYNESKKYLCNYTDLYEKTIDNQILIDLLSEKYILDESITSLTKQQVRKVNYLSIDKGTYSTVEGTGDDEKLKENNLSSDFVYDVVLAGLKSNKTLEDIETIWKSYQTATIDFKAYNKENAACSYDTDSSYEKCREFTDNSAISLTEGVKRAKLEVLDSEYYFEDVLTNSDTTVFNESINGYLFSTTTASRLKTVNGKSYLVSTALPAGQKVFSDENIIITDTTNSKYIFLEVTIIDENTEDAGLLLEAAHAVIADNDELFEDALTHYLNKYKVTVHTELFEDYLEQSFPSVKFYR